MAAITKWFWYHRLNRSVTLNSVCAVNWRYVWYLLVMYNFMYAYFLFGQTRSTIRVGFLKVWKVQVGYAQGNMLTGKKRNFPYLLSRSHNLPSDTLVNP